jgi:hypothetical protein
MNLPRIPVKNSLSATLYDWVQSTTNSVIYPPNILSNLKSTVREVLLLTEFSCLTNSGVQFLSTAVRYLLVFSTNIFNYSVRIIRNSPKKISCSFVYTCLCINCLLLIWGFLFSFQENSRSFPSTHSNISFLVDLQNIPSITYSRFRQHNHLLACMWL